MTAFPHSSNENYYYDHSASIRNYCAAAVEFNCVKSWEYGELSSMKQNEPPTFLTQLFHSLSTDD